MSTLSVEEVIEGLTDWLGDGVNSIYEELAGEVLSDEPGYPVELSKSDCIIVETTDGLKPHWMPTEIGCYQIVVRQGNMAVPHYGANAPDYITIGTTNSAISEGDDGSHIPHYTQ